MIFDHLMPVSLLLPVVLAAPWAVGVVVYWHARPRDGHLPPSHAELSTRGR